jgi:hypothetical protein
MVILQEIVQVLSKTHLLEVVIEVVMEDSEEDSEEEEVDIKVNLNFQVVEINLTDHQIVSIIKIYSQEFI